MRTPPDESDRDLTPVLRLVEQIQSALERQDRARLCQIIAQLVALRAPMGGQWQALAQIAANIGELRLSRDAIDLFVQASGETPTARYQKAALLTQSGAWREAYDLLCTLPEDVPDPASNAYSRGTSLLMLGKSEEARVQLERAVRMRPQSAPAWLGLAMSADLGRDSLLAEQIVAAEPGMARIAPAGRAPYYYALGKVHADRREPALAFPAFARGAQFQKSSSRYDRAAARRNAEEAVYGYSSGGMATITSQQDEQTGRTIFVTGLPRSGTTLVEQILTSHSAVTDGGEIARLDLVAREIGGASFPVLTRYVEGYSLEAITRLWDHWIDQRFPVPGRVVDKTLNNTRLLGLAAAILPEAPLIWVTRDPLDRAWSCFRTFFTGDMAWSYDLEDIAFHFRLEDQLLQRWQEVLGDRLLTVPYEALVTDSARWIRRIIGHCGLTEEPQVFVPHENDRPVITASVMQVRQPIHREGIGSAEPYRQFLEPFIAAYGG